MEWLKKLLEGKGLSDEQVNAIVAGVEDNYKSHIPKHRFDEVNEGKKQADDALKERDKQLSDLKKAAGDNEELKKQIETLQADNKKQADDYQTKLKDMNFSTAIKLAVTGEAHDPDLVAGLLDKSKLILGEDGKVTGLDDQLKVLRESKAFLFAPKQEDKKSPMFKGVNPNDSSKGQSQTEGLQALIEKTILGN